MRIVIVDHQDSFTFNLFHDIGELAGQEPEVFDHRYVTAEQVLGEGLPTLIVIGAGPGHPARPADAGRSLQVVRSLAGRMPMFGVCFGLQLFVQAAGGSLLQARDIAHGKSLPVLHSGELIFDGVPTPVNMMRYNSWVADPKTLPSGYRVLARSPEGEIMALAHRRRPQWAVQFHPESVGSEHGRILLGNVISTAGRWYGDPMVRESDRGPGKGLPGGRQGKPSI